jgi:carboxymethylenebutenolidase
MADRHAGGGPIVRGWIELSGDHGRAYRAAPPRDAGSGVLLLHAWWGLNQTIQAMCDRLAEAGFLAIAPDLYRGVVVDTIEAAERELEHEGEREAAFKAAVAAALVRLRGEPGVRPASLGVVGFSMGVYYALEAAATDPSIVAAVIYYGTAPDRDWTVSAAAFQGHFAELDPFEPLAGVTALEEALKRDGRRAEFHLYPGAGHWFMEPDRPDAYKEEAAELAWSRMLGFLRERVD